MKTALILNRRCVRHPERGGAERYTLELARALMELSYEVTWFCSRPEMLWPNENLDGVKYIRRGSEVTCHIYGFSNAIAYEWDLIIDEFNGVGFFCFGLRKTVLLIHQLYGEFWQTELKRLGVVFEFIEKHFLRLYKRKPVIAVSGSTRSDLLSLGFKDVTIIHNGCDRPPSNKTGDKNKRLTLIYLGRLKRTKNPEDAIKAFLGIREAVRDANLEIIGDGPLYPFLRRKYEGVPGIRFWGYVSDEQRDSLLRKAHFLLVPSIREGWGQVVIQANACGTPAIGFNVPGLRDSIGPGDTGLLVRDYAEMAKAVIGLWGGDKQRYVKLCENAKKWAGNFSWDRARKEFVEFLSERGFTK